MSIALSSSGLASSGVRPALTRRPQNLGVLIPLASVYFAVIGCAVLLVPQSTFVSLRRAVIVWMTFAVLLCAAASAYCIARRAGLSPWTTPVSLITIYYFIRYGWGTLVAEYWEHYPWKAYPHLRWNFHRFGVWQHLPAACQLILIFGMGMTIGGLLTIPFRRPTSSSISLRLSESRLKQMVIIYSPIGIVINSGLQFVLPDSVRFTVSLLGFLVYPLILLASYWLFSSSMPRERTKWTLFLAFACLATLPVGLVTGQVAGQLMPGVMVLMGFTLARSAPPWKAVLAAFPVLFLFLLPFASLYKSERFNNSNIPDRLSSTLMRFETASPQARLELALERTLMRFAGSNMPAVYVAFYPDVYHFEFGKSFVIEASTIVPRVLWPEKPYAAWELNRYPARVGMVEYEGTTTALFDAISEYYINFGTVGMFAMAIVHGCYWQALHNWLVLRFHPLIGSAVLLATIVMNEDFYGVGLSLTSHVKTIPVWLLILYLLGRKRVKDVAVQ